MVLLLLVVDAFVAKRLVVVALSKNARAAYRLVEVLLVEVLLVEVNPMKLPLFAPKVSVKKLVA